MSLGVHRSHNLCPMLSGQGGDCAGQGSSFMPCSVKLINQRDHDA